MDRSFLSEKEEDTIRLGKTIGKHLKPGDLVLLYGDLGAGKTTFIKGVAQGLKVDPQIYITSPTFSIINVYEGRYTIYHVDLYRLMGEELEELGIWEYLNQGILLIEWADRILEIPKEDFLEIRFEILEANKRKITLTGYGEWKDLLKSLDFEELSEQ
jgi:tRNA threonylcarbamoyladenosine biosynthesis protein TsaE